MAILPVSLGCLRFVIVVFPEQTHLLFLRQILRKKPTFVIANSNQPSHVKTTLTRSRKGQLGFLKGYPLEAKTAPKNETRVCIFSGPD